MEHPKEAVSRETLLQSIWGFQYDGDTRIVDVHVFKLKGKLKESRVSFKSVRGVGYKLVNLLMAVLEKRLGMNLGNCDAYVNIAGGIKMNEPAIDLGIVMALVSSYRNRPIDEKTIVFGEVGLSGEVRAVNMPEQRVAEAKKLGFETCILPEVCMKTVKDVKGIKLLGVKSVNEAVAIF